MSYSQGFRAVHPSPEAAFSQSAAVWSPCSHKQGSPSLAASPGSRFASQNKGSLELGEQLQGGYRQTEACSALDVLTPSLLLSTQQWASGLLLP